MPALTTARANMPGTRLCLGLATVASTAKLRPMALSVLAERGSGESVTAWLKMVLVVLAGVGVVGLDGAPEAVECIDWSMLAGWQARL